MTIGKTVALIRRTFVGKVMSLLLNMLSRLVITFLPRHKRLLISWLQSPSAVTLEPKKIRNKPRKLKKKKTAQETCQYVFGRPRAVKLTQCLTYGRHCSERISHINLFNPFSLKDILYLNQKASLQMEELA